MTRLLLICAFLVGTTFPAAADPLRRDQIPEPLKPWDGWVLHGSEAETCPFLSGNGTKQCAWPSRLDLALGSTGGTFRQEWWAGTEIWVPLPGGSEHWPLDVKVDGKPATAIEMNGIPQLVLKPGPHTVTGTLSWKQPPDSLPVPDGTGLLSLAWMGKPVAFPVHGDDGRLWLQKSQQVSDETDSVDLRVYRHILDAIPLQLTTQLVMNVSGKNREIALTGLILPGFIPMNLSSPLPVRLERNGDVKIQLRPGTWTLSLTGRHDGPVHEISLPQPPEGWPGEELWAFEAQNDLRLVTVEGVIPVDPKQTSLPGEWQHLPTYRLLPGETMKFAEKRRGDSAPAPDQMALRRNLWLDFNGGGFTVQDRLTGQLKRSSRLELSAPSELGRVSIDGEDQVISRRPGSPNAGFEVRRGELQVEADSRFPGGGTAVQAVGWDVDVNSLSAVLQIPPGWKLFHANGADRATNTWITRWTLLDFFIVLVTALAFFKLWGPRWGAAALFAFTITFTEQGAPVWIWVVIAAAEALLQALKEGRFRKFIVWFRLVSILVLALTAIPFAVWQLRIAMYPALEFPHPASGFPVQQPELMRAQPMPAAAPPAEQGMDDAIAGSRSVEMPAAREFAGNASLAFKSESKSYYPRKDLQQVDPSASVNTGPGLPRWSWNRSDLSWSGPVTRSQTLKLYLIPPWGNFALALLRVGLITALAFRLLRGRPDTSAPTPAGSSALVFALMMLSPGTAAAADYPPPEMLNELRTRLLTQYDCHPNCAVISKMLIEAKGNNLRLRLSAASGAPAAVALPGDVRHWSPSRAILDGRSEPPMFRSGDGALWLLLEPGAHDITLEGPLPDREQVRLPLPALPRNVSVLAGDWTVDGLRDDGGVESSLTLTRRTKRTGPVDGAETSVELPPFLLLRRELELGLEWRVSTTVTRLTPPGSSTVTEVPLLEGESVTTSGIQVKNGKVTATFGPQTESIAWESVLKIADTLRLEAVKDTGRTEIWVLDASPIWHVETDGIPPVHRHDEGGLWRPEWKPWPGETLTLKVARPEGVSGQTLTVDESRLTVSPGNRTADTNLEFTARSSRGGQHAITLPGGAELQSVEIDGSLQPVRQEGRTVTIPLTPGQQTVKLGWRENTGIDFIYQPAVTSMGIPTVNSTVEIKVPDGRWVLFLKGPRLGPAVLFWSLLAAVALVSVGLGAVRFVPVTYLQWFLLGLGLSQIELWAAAVVPLWLLAIGWRRENGAKADGTFTFNLLQILLTLLTLAAFAALFAAIQQGLLGPMEMHITGNGSTRWELRWFTDRTGPELPGATMVSAPMWVYRAAMLAWSLWLAVTLIRWLRWGWESLNEGGLWRKSPEKPAKPPDAPKPPKKDYLNG